MKKLIIAFSVATLLLNTNAEASKYRPQDWDYEAGTSARIVIKSRDADTLKDFFKAFTYDLNAPIRSYDKKHFTFKVPTASLHFILDSLENMKGVTDAELYTWGYMYDRDVLDEQVETIEQTKKCIEEQLASALEIDCIQAYNIELDSLTKEINRAKSEYYRSNGASSWSEIRIETRKKRLPGIVTYVVIGASKAVSWLFIRT